MLHSDYIQHVYVASDSNKSNKRWNTIQSS